MKRFLGVSAVVLLLGLASPSVIYAGPITFLTALPVASGQAVVRGQYVLLRASEDPTPLDRNLTVHGVPIAVAVGITPRLALFGVVPWLHKSLDLDTPMGRATRRVSGLGDSLVFARYTVFALDRPGSTLRVAPFGGVKLPTGDSTRSDALGRLPPALQLGSGSWDGLAGIAFTWQTLAWEFDANVAYRSTTEANGFRFGDQVAADASFQYRVWPRQLGTGVPAFLYAVVESNLTWTARNRVAGVADRGSGGTVWGIDLGLQYVRPSYILEVALQIPAVERLNGPALRSDYRLTAGLRWNITLPFQ